MTYLLLGIVVCRFLFFFFKQKTAYEMRISDWSSDVCSSDLIAGRHRRGGVAVIRDRRRGRLRLCLARKGSQQRKCRYRPKVFTHQPILPNNKSHKRVFTPAGSSSGRKSHDRSAALPPMMEREIGRASCRERVCQYV